MKIAVITSSYPRFPGDGTAPFVKSICEHLAKAGHAVEVVAPYDPAVAPQAPSAVRVQRFRYAWPERLHIMGHARSLENDTRLRPLSYLLLPFFLAAAFLRLMAVTGRQNSDAIHAHWVIPNGLVAAWVARLRGIPFIISLHGSDVYIARRSRLFGAVAGWVFRRAAAVTACSPDLQAGALALGAGQGGAGQAPVLLPWGADPQVFSPKLRTRLPGDALRIAALGRFVPKKGFDHLLEAMPRVLDSHPQAELALGGDGALMSQFRQKAAQLGAGDRIQFPGGLAWDQVPGFLANADIFVLPSVRDARGNVDGLPTVLLEAMSSGIAIVASDIGGVSLVIEHGRNGLLAPPGDTQALTQAILTLANDQELRQQLGQAARRSVVERFNWDEVARQIAGLLELAVFQTGAFYRQRRAPRLGTLYRLGMLQALNERADTGSVLDIGCHDGYFLSTQRAPVRIGADLEPAPGAPGIAMLQTDACELPFGPDIFDRIFALDVIEHVEDEQAFVRSLCRVLAPGGKLFLSTPSLDIRLTPAFLTGWISRQWGHTLRLGYTHAHLSELFEESRTTAPMTIRCVYWSAPAYRFFYLPVRLLSVLAPGLAAGLVRRFVRWDAGHRQGKHGFVLVEAWKGGHHDA